MDFSPILKEFERINDDDEFIAIPAGASHARVVYRGKSNDFHYEWWHRRTILEVAFHIEAGSTSESYLGPLKICEERIKKDVPYPFLSGKNKLLGAHFGFELPIETGPVEAANVMKILINTTWPIIQPHVPWQ